MTLDPAILTRLVVSVDVTDYVRIIARVHAEDSLGHRIRSIALFQPKRQVPPAVPGSGYETAFAETIVRDRYEKSAERLLLEEELDRYSIAVVRNPRPLFLLDLRNEGASLLGISTRKLRRSLVARLGELRW